MKSHFRWRRIHHQDYKAVGGALVMEREGPYFYDVDSNKYIDYLAAYARLLPGTHIQEFTKR